MLYTILPDKTENSTPQRRHIGHTSEKYNRVEQREGGSIPIVSDFNHTLNTPVGLMGFGLPDENLYAPNEHFT
jgi:hypothetical protein